MANNIIRRVWNQNRMVNIEDLYGAAFQAESGGHTFEISGIDDTGAAVTLSGTVSGVFRRPDNADIALTGSASDGVASVTLSEDCYAVPGRFGLTIFVTSNSQKVAVYACVGTVAVSSTGNVAGDTPASVEDLIDDINAAIADLNSAIGQIPASYANVMAAIAPTYSGSALYPVGSYTWYDGALYRCTTPITTAEAWTAAHWTAAVLGDGVSNLKSAFEVHNGVLETAFATEYETAITLTEAKSINADGTLYNSSDSSFKHSKLLAVKPGKTYAYSFQCGVMNFNFRVLGYTSEATDTAYSTAPFVKLLDFKLPTVNSVNRGTFVVDDPSIAYVRFSGRTQSTNYMIGGKIDCMGDFLDGSVSDMISNAISEDYASESLWEQGSYNGQTPGVSTIRLRTIDYFTADVFPSVHVLSGYEILIIAWNKITGAYVGTWGANGTAFVTEGTSTYVLDFDFTRFPDYKFKAVLRNKNNTSATIIPAEGVNAVFRKINFATIDSEIHPHASYTRLYSDITSDLVWQNKTITTEGISDSSTEVIAQLPSSGNVEIRMRRNTEDSQFSIWQKVGDTITMMCDWTHYQYRYTGDYSPEYYVRVKTEATSNRDFVLKHCTVAYKYCDQGENKDAQTRMFGKKVAVFGDSVVQGKVRKNQATDVNSLTCKPWSSLIGEVNGDFSPHNFGIGGATVANTGTTTYPDWKSLYTRRNEITGFDIVIICAGINDYGAAVTESAFRTAYAAVLDALIANNTQVVVATLCARSTNTANSAGLRPSDYAAIEKEIATAKSLTVIDLYAGTDNAEYKAQLPDGLHPNEIGHQIIANLVLSGY